MYSVSAIFTSTARTLNLIGGDNGAKIVGFDIYAPDKSSAWRPTFSVKRKANHVGGDDGGASKAILGAQRSPTVLSKLGGDGDSYSGGGDFTSWFNLTIDPDRPMTFSYRCKDGVPVTLSPAEFGSGNFFQLFVADTYGSQDVIATIYWTETSESSYYAETEFTSSSRELDLVAGAAGALILGFDIIAPYTSNTSKPLIRAQRLNNWDSVEGAGNASIIPLSDIGEFAGTVASSARLGGTATGENVVGWWYAVSLDPTLPSVYKVRFDPDKRIQIPDGDFFQLKLIANYIDDVVARIYFSEPSA